MDLLPLHLITWWCEEYLHPLDVAMFRLTSRRYRNIPPKRCDQLCAAIRAGNEKLVELLLSWRFISMKAFAVACFEGHIDILHLLAKAYPEILSLVKDQATIVNETALYGKWEMFTLQFATGWAIDSEKICEYVAASGDLEFLKFVVNLGYEMTDHTICLAALAGSIPMMEWILEKGQEIQDCTLLYSVYSCEIASVAFVLERCLPEHKTAKVTAEASRYKENADMLCLLLQDGCSYDIDMWNNIIKTNNVKAARYLMENHYEVPKLDLTCASDEIVDIFQLSKR